MDSVHCKELIFFVCLDKSSSWDTIVLNLYENGGRGALTFSSVENFDDIKKNLHLVFDQWISNKVSTKGATMLKSEFHTSPTTVWLLCSNVRFQCKSNLLINVSHHRGVRQAAGKGREKKGSEMQLQTVIEPNMARALIAITYREV